MNVGSNGDNLTVDVVGVPRGVELETTYLAIFDQDGNISLGPVPLTTLAGTDFHGVVLWQVKKGSQDLFPGDMITFRRYYFGSWLQLTDGNCMFADFQLRY